MKSRPPFSEIAGDPVARRHSYPTVQTIENTHTEGRIFDEAEITNRRMTKSGFHVEIELSIAELELLISAIDRVHWPLEQEVRDQAAALRGRLKVKLDRITTVLPMSEGGS